MLTIPSIFRRINTFLIQSNSIWNRQAVPVNQRNEIAHEGYGDAIFSGWLSIDFVRGKDYWKADIAVPELSTNILNHAEILIYFIKGDTISKVTHYTDKDFGSSHLWMDHCILPEKILLISNFDASALYKYIILPEEAKHDIISPPPDRKNYIAVCRYFHIPIFEIEKKLVM